MRRLPLAAILLFCVSSLFAGDAPVVSILSYHEVVPGGVPPFKTHPPPGFPDNPTEANRYTLDSKVFAEQLDYIAKNYEVIPLVDLVDYISGRREDLPSKSVVITVDDGYLSTYKEIFPLMQKREMPFTLFVYPQIVDLGKNYLTWQQIAEMAKAGVDIESHTFSHPLLRAKNHPEMTPDAYGAFLKHELLDSRNLIEEKTGKPVKFIAYPYSDVDPTVTLATRQFGYEAALYDSLTGARLSRSTRPMHLVRYAVVHDTSLDQLKAVLP